MRHTYFTFLATIVLWLLPQVSTAQGQYMTRSGEITFEASVPTFEPIKATNTGSTAIFDTQTGEFAALALVRGFRFRVALMEEHFNENYIESHEYPKTSFKGTIADFDASKLNDGPQKLNLTGALSLHGVTQNIELPVKIHYQGEQLLLSADFSVRSEDYAIEIPKLVRKQIAETVNISVRLRLNPK
jgi:hypothetical protein